MSDSADQTPARQRSRAWAAVPVIVFGGLAVAMFFGLRSGDPSIIPSALVDKPVPEFTLDPLPRLKRDGEPVPGLATADLASGEVTLVNIWASWCGPCRVEHPLLMQLDRSGIRLAGINYKDEEENARRFLGTLGNPYRAVGVDDDGRSSIDWGVYGVPETFVVDGNGVIRFKHVGPLSANAVENGLLPAIERAKAAN